jgi:hypothetical protein
MEEAQNDLAAALELTGHNSVGARTKYDALAETMARTTRLTREQVYELATHALTIGVNERHVEGMTRAAIGLGRAYRMDVQSAMMLLIRAYEGNFMGLRRHGIQLKLTGDVQRDFNALLELGASKFALEEARVGTLTGQMNQLQKSMSEGAETFGQQLAPTVIAAIHDIKAALDSTDWAGWGGRAAAALEPVANLLHSLTAATEWVDKHTAGASGAISALQTMGPWGMMRGWAERYGTYLGSSSNYAPGVGGIEHYVGPTGRSVGYNPGPKRFKGDGLGGGASGEGSDDTMGTGILPRVSFASFDAAWKAVNSPHEKTQNRIAHAVESIEKNTRPRPTAPGKTDVGHPATVFGG